MAKPWVVVNAQNETVARLEGGPDGPKRIPAHLEAAANAGLLSVQYRPRKAKAKREFPYVGDHKL